MTNDLITRLESADGPSYALDCEIWDQIYPGERQARFDKLTAKGQPYHMRLGPADIDGYVQPLRSFTASIDAALTLVPEGWNWMAGNRNQPIARAYVENSQMAFVGLGGMKRNPDRQWFECVASTPALALAAAALKARGV